MILQPMPQLTINLVALIVAFVAAITNGETPLNVLQLLWVNLIMDSLAALGGCWMSRCCARFVWPGAGGRGKGSPGCVPAAGLG